MKAFVVVKCGLNPQEGYVLDLSPEVMSLAVKEVIGVPVMRDKRRVGTVLAARMEHKKMVLELVIDDEETSESLKNDLGLEELSDK